MLLGQPITKIEDVVFTTSVRLFDHETRTDVLVRGQIIVWDDGQVTAGKIAIKWGDEWFHPHDVHVSKAVMNRLSRDAIHVFLAQ